MRAAVSDGCGCFPTGRHYPGIAHLLRMRVPGIVDTFAVDAPLDELEIAMIDVETTGREPGQDRVIELGIVIGRAGRVVDHANWLIQPGIPIQPDATAVHGIKDEDLVGQPKFEEIVSEVERWLAGRVPAAYNAPFDRQFLHSELQKLGRTSDAPAFRHDVAWIDPLIWARFIQSNEKSRALGDVAQRLGISLENAHRAKDDAEAALNVFYALAADPRVPRTYGALLQEQRRHGFEQADERRMWRS